jgi:hypothetical protein
MRAQLGLWLVPLLLSGCGNGVKERSPALESTPSLELIPEPKRTLDSGTKQITDRSQPVECVPAWGELTEPRWSAPPNESNLPSLATLQDDFSSVSKTAERWFVTRKNDFAECLIGVVPARSGNTEGRLRLGCATRGTDDRTVKYLGIATRARLRLKPSAQLSFDVDWNDQANGCYLSGALILCPTLTTGNPEDQSKWFKLEYIGVPPGRNARAAVWLKNGTNRLACLHDEGWPKAQRTGRVIARHRVELHLENGQWTIRENGTVLATSKEDEVLPFDEAYIYLQMSSHSNYPKREIFFDNIKFNGSSHGQMERDRSSPQF